MDARMLLYGFAWLYAFICACACVLCTQVHAQITMCMCIPNTKYASFLCIFESCFTCFGLLGWVYDFQAWNWTAGTSGDSQRAAGCQQIKKYAILDRLSVFLNCSNLHFQQAYLQTNGMDILRWLKMVPERSRQLAYQWIKPNKYKRWRCSSGS